MKTCTRCEREKPYTAFNRKATNPDGYQYHCKDCRRLEQGEYRKTHAAAINERAAEWRKNSPAWKRWWQRYYKRNKDRLNAKSRMDGKRRYAAVRGRAV